MTPTICEYELPREALAYCIKTLSMYDSALSNLLARKINPKRIWTALPNGINETKLSSFENPIAPEPWDFDEWLSDYLLNSKSEYDLLVAEDALARPSDTCLAFVQSQIFTTDTNVYYCSVLDTTCKTDLLTTINEGLSGNTRRFLLKANESINRSTLSGRISLSTVNELSLRVGRLILDVYDGDAFMIVDL